MGTVRVGVVTTHLPGERDSPGWLVGLFRGGAELSDHDYLSAAPAGVVWEYTTPALAHQFDRVLVTSVDMLTSEDADELARLEPVVFLHHEVAGLPQQRRIVEAAECLILHTPAHAARTLKWCEPRRVEYVLSAIDTSVLRVGVKEDFALAACRDHPLKGLKNARIWAAKNDMRLEVMTREERVTVLEAMSRAAVFVHLPMAFESECRSIIEAVLSGCRIVTNDLVGLTSVPGWDDPAQLRAMVDEAAAKYWSLVCP
jgi:hypothetical protein